MATPQFERAEEERFQLVSIAACFDDAASFPDLVVYLDGQAWRCHKMILSMRSEWFRKACSGNFKEGGAPEIELHEDDPYALEAALEYCYTLRIASKERAHESEMGDALFHVCLFAVAEKYVIKGLTDLAAVGFIKIINSDELSTQLLIEAIQEVYTATTDSKRILRSAIIKKTLSNASFYLGGDKECFNKLMTDVPEFAADMVKALANDRPEKRAATAKSQEPKFECPTTWCHGTFSQFSREEITSVPALHEGHQFTCEFCWGSYRRAEWKCYPGENRKLDRQRDSKDMKFGTAVWGCSI